MKYFGILFNGKALGFSETSNGDDAEFCNPTSVELEENSDRVWLVKDRKDAEKAMVTETPWYNSCYQNPENPFLKKQDKLAIFEVEIP